MRRVASPTPYFRLSDSQDALVATRKSLKRPGLKRVLQENLFELPKTSKTCAFNRNYLPISIYSPTLSATTSLEAYCQRLLLRNKNHFKQCLPVRIVFQICWKSLLPETENTENWRGLGAAVEWCQNFFQELTKEKQHWKTLVARQIQAQCWWPNNKGPPLAALNRMMKKCGSAATGKPRWQINMPCDLPPHFCPKKLRKVFYAFCVISGVTGLFWCLLSSGLFLL